MSGFSLPAMFNPQIPFPVAQEGDGYDMPIPISLSEVPMSSAPNLFNGNFDAGMSLWKQNLPQTTLYDSTYDGGIDETAQSQNEIVQKVLLAPSTNSKSYQQSEFFFVERKTSTTSRAHYSSQSQYPCTAKTLYELKSHLGSISVKDLVSKYQPMGCFFTYVEKGELNGNYSKLVAYTCGGLCDIQNVWHVKLVPGMKLFIVAYQKGSYTSSTEKTHIIAYAGMDSPMENKHHIWNQEKHAVAIIEIGILCVGNSRPAQQTINRNYLVDSTGAPTQMFTGLSAKQMDPFDPTTTMTQNNILRIRMSALQWQTYETGL